MDNELILQQFEEIEKRIEKLIEVNRTLENTQAELEAENRRLATELQRKIEEEKQQAEVKNVIRSKIDSLMGRLDGIAGVEQA